MALEIGAGFIAASKMQAVSLRFALDAYHGRSDVTWPTLDLALAIAARAMPTGAALFLCRHDRMSTPPLSASCCGPQTATETFRSSRWLVPSFDDAVLSCCFDFPRRPKEALSPPSLGTH